MNMLATANRSLLDDLALQLTSAVFTKDSKHPKVIVRGQERGFKLKLHERNPKAPLSPYYLDLRTLDDQAGPLCHGVLHYAALCMRNKIASAGVHFTALAGVPRAGEPFANEISTLYREPNEKRVVTLEKVIGEDGRRQIAWIKGRFPVNTTALLVDDLITEADSKIEAIRVLRDADVKVTDVLVLVDREQGGREKLKNWGCTLHSVLTISELLDLCVEGGRLTPTLHSEIKEYLAHAA